MNAGKCSLNKEVGTASNVVEETPAYLTTSVAKEENPSASVEEPIDAQFARLLHGIENGDTEATKSLVDMVYSELRTMASQKLSRHSATDTLNATALVHEAWIKLNPGPCAHFENRAHFFGAAAEAMRRILVDRARARKTSKRGRGKVPLDVYRLEIPAREMSDDRLVDLHDALDKFAALYPQKAELVKLRFFVGLTIEEAAEILGIAVPTAKKWWAYARGWFQLEMKV